jgi:hypothetical protein
VIPKRALLRAAHYSATTPLQTDVWIYRAVVVVLGTIACMSVLGAIVLALASRSTPEVLVALGSACVGALAGLLAPRPRD